MNELMNEWIASAETTAVPVLLTLAGETQLNCIGPLSLLVGLVGGGAGTSIDMKSLEKWC